MINFGTLIRLV